MAKDKEDAAPAAKPAATEQLDRPTKSMEEYRAEEAERMGREEEENRRAIASAPKSNAQEFRVKAERIGHKILRKATERSPIVIAHGGGLTRNDIVTKDQLASFGWLHDEDGKEDPRRLTRFIKLGAIVPIFRGPDGQIYESKSADQVGPHAVQE